MKMKKNLLLVMGAAMMLVFGISSCSSSDDEISERSNDEVSETNDTLTLTAHLGFQDESGVEKYVFKEGENIVFRLDVINNSEEDVIIHGNMAYILLHDAFHVYSSQGEDFGKPYDVYETTDIGITMILSKGKETYLCQWLNDPNSELLWKPYYIHYIIDKRRPLPKGDYYSQFTIRLGDNQYFTCKRSFKIE